MSRLPRITQREADLTMKLDAAGSEIERLRLERNQFHAALRRQRAAIIEECARMAEPMKFSTAEEIAAAIRQSVGHQASLDAVVNLVIEECAQRVDQMARSVTTDHAIILTAAAEVIRAGRRIAG